MSDISQETHDALLKKAVDDATKTTEAALSVKTEEASTATKRVTELEAELSTAKEEAARLNTELDAAQVKLTSATEEVAGLKKDAAAKEEAAQVAEIASKRAEQVKNLKLFTEDFVTEERAARWAAQTDEAWGEQLEEWKQLKPAASGEGEGASDTASAMTGTSDLTKEDKNSDTASGAGDDKKSTRRAALGLA